MKIVKSSLREHKLIEDNSTEETVVDDVNAASLDDVADAVSDETGYRGYLRHTHGICRCALGTQKGEVLMQTLTTNATLFAHTHEVAARVCATAGHGLPLEAVYLL